ncbi:MAG: hypothetical protein ACKVOM_01830 [Ferruginibacter sp.]
MLETKWEIDQDNGKGWSYEKTGDIFSEIKTNELEEKLLIFLKESDKCYHGNLFDFTLRQGFLPKHTTEIFSSLQTDNRIEVLSDNNEKVRKGAFYINYENYKNEFKKVYFKVK